MVVVVARALRTQLARSYVAVVKRGNDTFIRIDNSQSLVCLLGPFGLRALPIDDGDQLLNLRFQMLDDLFPRLQRGRSECVIEGGLWSGDSGRPCVNPGAEAEHQGPQFGVFRGSVLDSSETSGRR